MQNFLGTLSQFYDNATGLFGMPDISFSFVDIVEILIISFLFYHILLWIKNTRAWNLFKGIIVILLFVLVAAIFQMNIHPLAGRKYVECRTDGPGDYFPAGTSEGT